LRYGAASEPAALCGRSDARAFLNKEQTESAQGFASLSAAQETSMRSYILALAGAALIYVPSPAPTFAQGIEVGPGGIRVDPGYRRQRHYGYSGSCRELRKACLNKEELGERGQGNCARYRRLCQ
jgi:hypothetical protein